MVHEGRPWWTLSAMATKSPLRSCGSISRASTACAAFMRQYPSRRQMNRLRIASTFRAGTRNFSTLEYGALVMLMDCFWCEGKLPDDDEVRRLAKLSKPQWAKSRARIAEKFGPNWSRDELAEERSATAANIRSKRESRRLGGNARVARMADVA
jgi:hypothetical protein